MSTQPAERRLVTENRLLPGGDLLDLIVSTVAPGGEDPGGEDPAGLAAHIADPTPHPAYDDLPSLTVLFQNRLV